jgi:ATP synthase protein I
MEPGNPRRPSLQKLAALSNLGLLLPSSIIVGLFMGYWLDKLLGTRPWLTLSFLVLGIVSGFLSLFRGLKKLKLDSEDDADVR